MLWYLPEGVATELLRYAHGIDIVFVSSWNKCNNAITFGTEEHFISYHLSAGSGCLLKTSAMCAFSQWYPDFIPTCRSNQTR